ncbi:MAG: carboxyl transferase domain-containing protein [bacterium]
MEVGALAGLDTGGGVKAGASIVAGVGVVSGVECLISATDSTIKGGAMNAWSVQKTRRLAELADANRLPTINLVESAGADLPQQAQIFVPGGRAFRDLTRASRARQPTVCLVFGSSTAGGAYIPGMSDYVVMVEGQARVTHVAGPPHEDGHQRGLDKREPRRGRDAQPRERRERLRPGTSATPSASAARSWPRCGGRSRAAGALGAGAPL